MNTIESQTEATIAHTARRTGTEELTTAVIEAVATAEGIEPADLDVRITDVVEPDALNTLFESVADRSGYVTFPLSAYLVRVFANGEIVLYDP